MIDVETAYEICLSMPEAEEYDHFGKPAFRVIGGKTFLTMNLDEKWCTLKFTPEQQVEFCENPAIYPVPNKWGKWGWTHADLEKIRKQEFIEIVKIAWQNVLSKK
jgi:predicted DNA-binding protein (MmcQ/YjbR family)